MLSWALIFFVLSMAAGLLGFGGVAAASAGIAQILFYIFVGFFVIAMIAHFA
jgi:uncharacterized membrane protein YtjA (UPF0391 family)